MGRIESKEQAEAWLRYIEQSKVQVSQRYINELRRRAGHRDIDPMDAVVEQMEDMLDDILFGDEEEYSIPYDPNDPIQVELRKLDQILHFGQTYEEVPAEVAMNAIQRKFETVGLGKPMSVPLVETEFDGLQKLTYISGKPAPVFKQEIMGEFYKEDDENEEG